MNILDLFIVIVFSVSIFFSFIKGFIREFFSILSVIFGIYLGSFYYESVGNFYRGIIDSKVLRDVAGFLSIFFGILLLSSLLIFLFNKLIKAANLKWLDRGIGVLFGFVRGWLIIAGVLIVMVSFHFKENMVEKSKLAPYILTTSRMMVYMTPTKVKKMFESEYDKIYKKWIEEK